jgi:hypothetical protein
MRRKKVSNENLDSIQILSSFTRGHLKLLGQKQEGQGLKSPNNTKVFALIRVIRYFAATFIYLSVCYIHFIASEYLQWELWGVFAMFSEYRHRIYDE